MYDLHNRQVLLLVTNAKKHHTKHIITTTIKT